MKNIYRIVILTIVVGCLGGCTNFLDLPPKNERAIQSLDDVKSVLAGYLYGQATPRKTSIVGLSPLFDYEMAKMFEAYSDNIDVNTAMPNNYLLEKNTITEKEYAQQFLWNNFSAPKNIWIKYYEVIGFLNALIDEMGEMGAVSVDDRAEANRVMGEMLTHRAYYIFKLLEYFAPYNKSEMGIPVYLHTGEQVVGVTMARKSHAEVYKVVLDDLNRALELLATTEPNKNFNIFFTEFRVNHILAQVYWFKAESPAKEATDYVNAKKYAEVAVRTTDGLVMTTTARINEVAKGLGSDYPGLYMSGTRYGAVSGIFASTWHYMGYNPTNVPANSEFYNLFSRDDVRYDAYFSGPNVISNAWPDGNVNGGKNGNVTLFKPEEAYLILAEAEYRLGGDAVAVLNKFKAFKNAGNANGLSGDPLLKEIVNERRKEFFGDSDKRWLDLKRFGGTISRHLKLFNKIYDLEVSTNDYRYALPIPLDELQQNGAITQNEGWVELEF